MKSKAKFSLSTQINLIFTAITLLTSILFILIFRQSIRSFAQVQADKNFRSFHRVFLSFVMSVNETQYSQYYAYAVYNLDNQTIEAYNYHNFVKEEDIIEFLSEKEELIGIDEIITYKNLRYLTSKMNKKIIITIDDGTYSQSMGEPISDLVMIGFVSIIILGNAIILVWSSITVERIKVLQSEVSNLTQTSYRKPIRVEGHDEIAKLAETIDDMRGEILKNDEVKQEMLQNLSHDIKTPIAVIKSYSEAIRDGITSTEDISIVLRQTDILSDKVRKLLEWNRIEYIDDKAEFYPVDMNKVITTVVNNFKFKRDIRFETDLDNSYLMGLDEHYLTLVSNIIENALRYAKTVIKVTLKNQKLTIYNDGEHINERFLKAGFKPYEKGFKGQFGLGLTIVQKIIANFNLKLSIKNCPVGVEFTIEPL